MDGSIVAALILGALYAPAPPGVVPRNMLEQWVLSPSDDASRAIEELLASEQAAERRTRVLLAAGFQPARPDGRCERYVYSRALTAVLVRGAVVTLCQGQRPFVLRSDETPRVPMAPLPGEPAVIAPSPPR